MNKSQRLMFEVSSPNGILLFREISKLLCEYGTCVISFFPGPLAFCKKAVEKVNSEKNILNSSVECVEWSGFF